MRSAPHRAIHLFVAVIVCLFLLRLSRINPDLSLVLYYLAVALGAVFLLTAPGARKRDWIVYGLAVALVVSMAWESVIGPPMVIVAAAVIAVGPA
jgi:hypothetical protein